MDNLLATHLDVQVQLYICLFLERDGPTDEDFAKASDISLLIAERSDNILYRGKKKGETAELVSKLAWGIALMSFCPGGIKVFGRHWETKNENIPKVQS